MNPPTLTGTAGDARNSLTWTGVPGLTTGAVKYRLRRAVGSAGYATIYTGPALGFNNTRLTNGTVYHYRVRGVDAAGKNGPWSNVVDLTPQAVVVPPPSGLVVVGWGSAVAGGDAEKAHPMIVRTYSDMKAALAVNAVRYVQISPSAVALIDGLGAKLDPHGRLTIDGSGYPGQLKRMPLRFREGGVKLLGLRLRMGDQVQDVGEADVITIIPPSGGSLSGFVIDLSSLLWSNDVVLAILNHSMDITVQRSLIGCGLVRGTNPSSPNGYGINVSAIGNNPNPLAKSGRRITFYRNYIMHNWQRNMKPEYTEFIDFVNNVFYNWGSQLGHGNPQGLNAIGNMFKKGPETPSSTKVWVPDTTYNQFPGSVYWADNIGRNRDGSPFTPTMDFGSGVRRSTPYGGGPHNVTVEPMTDALAAQIVAASGPTVVDAIDQRLKDDFTNGTGSFYNGQGHPAPNPSWP